MTYIPEAIRAQIFESANGRCEYCKLPEQFAYHRHEIDHIYAEKHGGDTNVANLCLACADCNRHKGSNLCSLDPLTGKITALYHPRLEQWDEHFYLANNAYIEPLTPQGRVTAKVLRFNRLELIVDRLRLMRLGGYS